MLGQLFAIVGDNSAQIDAAESEEKLRNDCPRLLQEDEHVVMAFQGRGGAGRDDHFFTTKRVIIRDVKAVTGQCVKYQSIPYGSIKAWSVDTAGALDTDCTLKLWSEGDGQTSIDYVAGKVDMFAIKRHFNNMCLVQGSIGAHVEGGAQATMPQPTPPGAVDKLLGFLGDDAHQLDAKAVESELKEGLKILADDEIVEMAFKAGRDSFLMTSKRILIIDVQGLTGKKVEYRSVLWRQIKMFSVETAGSFFDTDAELLLFTDIPKMSRIHQDLRKGKADVFSIQKYIADKLLGMDKTVSAFTPLPRIADKGSGSIFSWLGDDSRMIDANQADEQYHSYPPILQVSESVEMAFKGRRDLMLFTTKRLLMVDMKGFSGRKVNYISVPWTAVQAFGVRSAGAWLDKDSEMMIWTSINDVFWPPQVKQDDPPPPPIPRMSFLEMDFQKDKVDLMAVKRYLGARCLRTQEGGYLAPEVRVAADTMAESPPGGVEAFLNWVGDDARLIPAKGIEEQLRTVNPVLEVDEQVGMAYKVGRDMMIFTTKRVLLVDVQGWSGKKIEWTSIPYETIRGFSVRSAGDWDRDAEVTFFTKTYWMNGPGNAFSQDLRKGKCDIIAIQSYLAAQVIGRQDGSSALPAPLQEEPKAAPGGLTGFLAWIGDNAHEISAEQVDDQLHSAPSILQSDESVERAYRSGRDLFVFTTKRVVFIDVQGFTGKKVEYMSYPLRYCSAFAVQSAGMIALTHSAHATLYTSIPGASKIKQNLNQNNSNLWDVQEHLASKLLRQGETHQESNNVV